MHIKMRIRLDARVTILIGTSENHQKTQQCQCDCLCLCVSEWVYVCKRELKCTNCQYYLWTANSSTTSSAHKTVEQGSIVKPTHRQIFTYYLFAAFSSKASSRMNTRNTNANVAKSVRLQNSNTRGKSAFQSTALNVILLSSRYLLLMTWT